MVFSGEHKENLSKARKQRVTKIETRQKCSKTSTGKINIKQYILIDPNGKEHITTNGLSQFCKEHNISHGNMSNVLKGIRRHHKGWTIRRADDGKK